jgi:hypothetical protein
LAGADKLAPAACVLPSLQTWARISSYPARGVGARPGTAQWAPWVPGGRAAPPHGKIGRTQPVAVGSRPLWSATLKLATFKLSQHTTYMPRGDLAPTRVNVKSQARSNGRRAAGGPKKWSYRATCAVDGWASGSAVPLLIVMPTPRRTRRRAPRPPRAAASQRAARAHLAGAAPRRLSACARASSGTPPARPPSPA